MILSCRDDYFFVGVALMLGCQTGFQVSAQGSTMPAITIYTTTYCPYCDAALALLRKKNVAFEHVDVTGDAAARKALTAKANGRTTVPQIWIGDRHVGGCDDLYALDQGGELDPMLAP
jgi:glutaredoxin 3